MFRFTMLTTLDAPPSGEFTSDSDSNIHVMEKFTIGAEGVSKLLGGLKPIRQQVLTK